MFFLRPGDRHGGRDVRAWQKATSRAERIRSARCTAQGRRCDLTRQKQLKSSSSRPATTHIDRLARGTFDLSGIVERIVDAKAQSLAATGNHGGSATGGRSG